MTWFYALALSFVYLIWPAVASKFWIRPQMDGFYILSLILSSMALYRAEVLTLPFTEWPVWLKMESAAWLTILSLVWVTLLTKPMQKLVKMKVPKEGEKVRTPSMEYASSLYGRCAFAWVNSLVYLRYRRPIQDEDLPELEPTDQSKYSVRKYKAVQKKSFTQSLFMALRRDLIMQFLCSIPFSILIVAQPYFLNRIVKYIECKDCGAPTYENYAWVFALLGCAILESAAQQTVLHRSRRLYMHLVSICNAAVFAKVFLRKDVATLANDKPEEKEGGGEQADAAAAPKKDRTMNISNLVGVDIKEMENTVSYLHEIYGFPIQFGLSTYLLYNLLGAASIIGIVFMVITLPIPGILYSALNKLFESIMGIKDDRMDYLTEMLSAIRIVKFFGWESKFVEKITAARERELSQIKKTFVQGAVANIAWSIVPLLNILVLILSYTKYYGHEITASVLFTTLSLFNIMRSSLDQIPWIIMGSMRAVVSLKRISRFLADEEIVKDTTITRLDGKARVASAPQDHPVIGFVNATYAWPNKEQEQAAETKAFKKEPLSKRIKGWFSKKPEAAPVEPAAESDVVQERFKLKNISADFPVGKLSLIVGPTGSGKSALLLALLGELERLEGHMYLPRLDYDEIHNYERGSGIAYVSQTAWLQNSTIRANILFGKEFNQERYDAVVEGCALITDFEILEGGDATEIGDQGITLSGGQKQRLALARAIYSDANVLLLDDCLSAVDTHTGKQLFQTLTGPLLEGRTVLMATHQIQLTLNAASYVVVLEKGEILGAGTPETVMRSGWVDRVALATPIGDDESEVSTLDGEEAAKKAKKTDVKKRVAPKLTEDEKKEEGSIPFRVYKVYLSAAGGWPFWISLFLFEIFREGGNLAQNTWLAMWANAVARETGSFVIQAFQAVVPESIALSLYSAFGPKNSGGYGIMTMALFGKGTQESVNVEYYLGIYTLIGVVQMLFNVATNYYAMVVGNVTASRVLHAELLYKVSRAKIRFFDTTPIGRIINRFSADMSTIDEQVLFGLNIFMNTIISISGLVLVISINMPAFLISAVFIVGIYVVIGILFVPISRDLKRLNSNSRSPILNHFNETLNGVATIRAFGFQDRFLSTNLTNLDNNNRTFFLLWSTNRWLHWRVDLTGALVSFSTGMLILRKWDSIEPGWAAMSLSYSLTFTMQMVWVIRMYAQNEMNMNAVERVAEYMHLEEEPPAIIEGSRPPASWPHAGEIEVEHLTVKYAADTPDVLKDISFKIRAGEKVGVVGRTGSGKSTLAISLFRFMEPVRGSIRIDGIDIGKIGLHDLRTNLTIIPQDPVLFKGTLRSNLDPFGEREDRELWEALRRSHLIPADSAPTLAPVAIAAGSSSNSKDAPAAVSPAGSIKGSTSGDSEIVDPSRITLDTAVKENGSNFSQGQRQLVALARALVRQPKVIIMDEATASVDFETDLRIQTTIREEMAEATILTIAHRIRTIADFDRVLVLNQGEIAEFDTPYALMRKENGVFRSMCERSTEFDTLLALAEAKEKKDRQQQQ
ncbi:P-loop containing nucleoside triphosphate hydrolase protein [Gamsiella multidivaricata]|uniref:P-loop containing nucleoside triphosphate hydrolase protein n=1 Tax=Gamsiella multidivaricata TaxID=101098 RepID=UPI00221F3EC5|nr:P-loop containing nucleoside triphosphate hydrolase protein [Gamsiella multidivaricata]KAI7816898.1 P-loop containing nucleoside triphosphate hydrolase protein [Gamsiella multidivaricata]